MKKRLLSTLIASLVTLSAITASLCSCNSYDPSKVSTESAETNSQAAADVIRDENEGKTEKPVESRSETEMQIETQTQTEKPVETETETETETEAQTEEPLEINTLDDAVIFLKKLLSDAYIDSSYYNIENNDGQYSSYSSFTVKEAYKPRYSTDPNSYLLKSGTLRLAGDTDLRLGMKLDDLASQGWTFEKNDPESSSIPPYADKPGRLIKDSFVIDADIYNNGEETIEYKDGALVRLDSTQCEADYAHKTYKRSDAAPSFVLDNTITDSSSVRDVLLTFGAPDSISYFIDPDIKALSTVKVCYVDLGAGIDDSEWSCEYIDFIFSFDGSYIVEFSIMG